MAFQRFVGALLVVVLVPLLVQCAPLPAVAPERLRSMPTPVLVGTHTNVAASIPAPPAVGSFDMQLELAELRAVRASLTDQQRAAITAWDTNPVLRWNQLARDLVSRYRTDPVLASRVYALLSVAQYNALLTAQAGQQYYSRGLPSVSQGGVVALVRHASATYPSDQAALAAASAAILTHYFPTSAPEINAWRVEHQESRICAGAALRSDILSGDRVGQRLAEALLARAIAEEAPLAWDGVIPSGAGLWQIDPAYPRPPAVPQWADLQPWLMERPDQFRAPPPPVFGSAEFQSALQEVRRFSDTRTKEQFDLARFWADDPGTPTPPGHWNAIAADLIVAHRMPELDAARTMAFMNLALMDAGIAVWDAKYEYWFIRPWQADPQIMTVVKQPQHPSYPSGHAGFSGAAAEFLSAVFPERREALQKMADESALSRVYGGIHYRFDGTHGLEMGRAVGQLAVVAWRAAATPQQ